MRTLYPDIEPFDTGTLKVDDRHELYYEQCGNPQGKPVVLLHGGPGAGCSPKMRRFHDPAKYRIVLFDQRGSGRSTPSPPPDAWPCRRRSVGDGTPRSGRGVRPTGSR